MIYLVFTLGIIIGAVVGFCVCALLSISDDEDDQDDVFRGPQL